MASLQEEITSHEGEAQGGDRSVKEPSSDETAQALLQYATDRARPEEAVASAEPSDSVVSLALGMLQDAKSDLEDAVREISRDSAPNVEAWIENAKALRAEVDTARRLSNKSSRLLEEDDERTSNLHDTATHVSLLEKDAAFYGQLQETLQLIRGINQRLDDVEGLRDDGEIYKSLQILSETWQQSEVLPVGPDTKIVKLLSTRLSYIKDTVQERLRDIWKLLVSVDSENGSITIHKQVEGEPTTIELAIKSFQVFRETEAIAQDLWENIDSTVMRPRTDLRQQTTLSSLEVHANSISVSQNTADTTIKSMLSDIGNVLNMLATCLPTEFFEHELANVMMPILSRRIKDDWLDKAIPSSLGDMEEFQKALLQVLEFSKRLEALNLSDTDVFRGWVTDAHKNWLNKRRESVLSRIRDHLSAGLGHRQKALRVETEMVPRDESEHISKTSNGELNDDWDNGWDNEIEDLDTSDSGSGKAQDSERPSNPNVVDDEDEVADSWGWGQDDDTATEEPLQSPISKQGARNRRPSTLPDEIEMSLSEEYWISSIPKTIFDIAVKVFEDGSELCKPGQNSPISGAGAPLFTFSKDIFTMYRALSPYYYASSPSGNMYIYTDTMWLCDKLKDFAKQWPSRIGAANPSSKLVKPNTDAEVIGLQHFGRQAYTNELISQRTVVKDLMGDSQNIIEDNPDAEQSLDLVIEHIRQRSELWKEILPESANKSAVGSLVNTVAAKIISDVLDLSNLNVNDASRTAAMIEKVSELDQLFIRTTPNRRGELRDAAPETVRFVDKWLKMKWLSQVLQGNLAEIRHDWFESELSLYFDKEEIVDLIQLSFEDNSNSKALIRDIRNSVIEVRD